MTYPDMKPNVAERRLADSVSRRDLLRRFAALGLATPVVAGLLAACGGSASSPTTASTASTSGSTSSGGTSASGSTAVATSAAAASTPGATAASQPKAGGGSLVVAISIAIDTMDPGQITTTMLMSAATMVFNSLTALNKDNQLQPALATKWEASQDGRVWTFSLHPGVKFHDGTPFNAQAAKTNIDRILNPANNMFTRSLIDKIVEVKVVDDLTVQTRTEQPFGPMPIYMAHPDMGMVSPAVIEKYGKDVATHPVGTGRFKVQSYPSTERLDLVRNDEYWGEPAGAEKLSFRSVTEATSRLAMLQNKEADVVVNVPPQLVDSLKSDSQLAILTGFSSRVAHIGFNMLRPQYQDVRVRRALNHAVDVNAIVTSVMKGFAKRYPSPFTPFSFGFSEIYTYDYNPDKAKQLLQEAGWKPASDGKLSPDGQPFKMTIDTPINRYLLDQETTEAVVGYLQKLGINAVSHPMEFQTYWAIRRGNDAKDVTDCYYMAWADPNGDLSFAMQSFQTEYWAPGNNFGFYKNPDIDKLAQQGLQESDPEKRKAIYKQAQQIIMDDAPYIFLFSLGIVAGQRADVQGVALSPSEFYMLGSASRKQ